LVGETIPLVGRIVAVADMFDSACSKRVYKPAIPFDDVVAMVHEESGKRLDPKCAKAFLDALPEVKSVYLELLDG
jgi:putative two-component system response regulator